MPRIGRSTTPTQVEFAVAVGAEPEPEDLLDRHATGIEGRSGDAPDEVRLEALVARRHRRVDREDRVAADPGPGVVERGAVGDELAGPLGEEEGRVALVEMPDSGRQAECPDRTYAPDPEDQLLVQAHLAAADVEDVGDRAVFDRVVGDVRVEQQDWNPAHLGQPDGDRQVAPRQVHRNCQRQAVLVLDAGERQPAEVVVGIGVLLVAVGVDRLAEVALAVEEADPDERKGHVTCRLHVVAGQHPEATRIDAKRLMDAVFGAEIGDRAAQPLAVAPLEPVTGAVGHVAIEIRQDVVILREELLVVEQT